MLNMHSASLAAQLSFAKDKMDKDISFSYQWLDHSNAKQNLKFSLPKQQVHQQVHRKFIPEIAQKYVYLELHKAARKIDPRQARIEIQKRAQNISVKVTSPNAKLVQKWQQSMQRSEEQAFTRYLADHYYSRFNTPLGQVGVKPDHLRYIVENTAVLKPLAQAFVENVPKTSAPRDYVNLMLSWVQSIPYNTLENRLESNGGGYLPPLSVVANNQGDCDSKSTLMATLLRAWRPQVKMVMIYLPGHALLGINLPGQKNEKTFDVGGIEYLMMEPTGPAAMALGAIGLSSERHIASGMLSYQTIL
jgi:hypothetical protein